MVRVHLAELGDHVLDAPVRAFRELAERARITERLHDDPAEADLILFTQAHMLTSDPRLRMITEHPLRQRFPERVAVYDERDRPRGTLRGVYTSMPSKHWEPDRFRACAYHTIPRDETDSRSVAPDLLFSFVGSPTAACREPLFRLRHPDAVVERIEQFMFWDTQAANFAARRARYREITARSRFVLCPRGHGTSSIRLYEVLAAGRVPVIVADEWVPPTGPDWSAFSLRWPERRIEGLVELLSDHLDAWPEMAQRATAAYERFFAPEVAAIQIFDQCGELIGAPPASTRARWRQPGYRRAAWDGALSRARHTVMAALRRG